MRDATSLCNTTDAASCECAPILPHIHIRYTDNAGDVYPELLDKGVPLWQLQIDQDRGWKRAPFREYYMYRKRVHARTRLSSGPDHRTAATGRRSSSRRNSKISCARRRRAPGLALPRWRPWPRPPVSTWSSRQETTQRVASLFRGGWPRMLPATYRPSRTLCYSVMDSSSARFAPLTENL